MAQIRSSRIASRLRLVDLASRVGLSVGRLSDIERGAGADTRLRTFVRLGKALERPFAANLTRALGPERLVDAAHLATQEWVLAVARRFAWRAAGWEVPTRPLDPRRSIDVIVRIGATLVLFECWNTIRDLGDAVRATNRKLAEAAELAVALGAEQVVGCWLVRPTAANRSIVRSYPEAIRTRFAASRAWVETLRGDHGQPPDQLGFVWLDPASGPVEVRVPDARGRSLERRAGAERSSRPREGPGHRREPRREVGPSRTGCYDRARSHTRGRTAE